MGATSSPPCLFEARDSHEGRDGACSFSFNDVAWLEAGTQDEGVVGPLPNTLGWDFYKIMMPVASEGNAGNSGLYVRRQQVMRLVRVYGTWPTNKPPLASSVHSRGLQVLEITLPEGLSRFASVLVAVYPPATSVCIAVGPGEPQQDAFKLDSGSRSRRRPFAVTSTGDRSNQLTAAASLTAAAASVAAAAADAEAAELESSASLQYLRKAIRPSAGPGVGEACVARGTTCKSSGLRGSGGLWPTGGSRSPDAQTRREVSGMMNEKSMSRAVDTAATRGRETEMSTILAAAEAVAEEALNDTSESASSSPVQDSHGNQHDGHVGSVTMDKLLVQVAALTAELAAEREARQTAQADALRCGTQLESVQQERDDLSELLRSAEREAESLCSEELADLTRRLRAAERATMASEMRVRSLTGEFEEARASLQRAKGKCASVDDVVGGLATLELASLRACMPQEKVAEKRRLLLRWHPDKNRGDGCGDIATRVLQEMQGRPEWDVF